MNQKAEKLMRFPSPDPAKPYVYPGSKVLINKFGIRSTAVLDRVTGTISGLRTELLRKEPLNGDFGFRYLRDIHHYLFQDIFEWAGQLRLVDTVKEKHNFVVACVIRTEASKVFAGLHSERALQGLSRKKFIERAACYYVEINQIHPFREGNGRAQRFFFEQLSMAAGYPLDFGRRKKKVLYDACYSALLDDPGPMQDLFEAITL